MKFGNGSRGTTGAPVEVRYASRNERAEERAQLTFLETKLPYKHLSLVATADRRVKDPTYSVHRWWARRPPGVIRGLLLASALQSNASTESFWNLFASEGHPLNGWRVHDLFVGGGTTVVEANRLGADSSGTDVDPLAVRIVKHELRGLDPQRLERAAKDLIATLTARVAHLFAPTKKGWTPLHYFFVHRVVCPHCSCASTLHRNLLIARDRGLHGGVNRDFGMAVFCPDCLKVHHLKSADRKRFRCCRQHPIDSSNFVSQRFICPNCSRKSSHSSLQTGKAERVLIAIEETHEDATRRIRQANKRDRQLLDVSREFLRARTQSLKLPNYQLRTNRRDSRPVSFGFTRALDFFTDRQLAVFGEAFKLLEDQKLPLNIANALVLGLSNALGTNNRLCSYATDYGRLAPLFSVRGYSLPFLSVELNPFHESAGRGTLHSSLDKVVRSASQTVRRYAWSDSLKRIRSSELRFALNGQTSDIRCLSAAKPFPLRNRVDICLFDPPYFDYIAYSELSEFYRAWLNGTRLGGKPLLPDGKAPVASYSVNLAKCLLAALRRLKKRRPLAFTFHSSDPAAWDAIGQALDSASLSVTAIWPIKNDTHMGHHAREANCEWDVVVVCRRATECKRKRFKTKLSDWRKAVAPLKIRAGDRTSLAMALAMTKSRYAQPKG